MTKSKSAKGISRREFVKTGVAAGIASQALPALGQSADCEPVAEINWDYSADVIIAGAGTAGLSAAIEALDHGASVIIVEENHDCGGHGLWSAAAGSTLGGGTSRQRAHGIEDSADAIYEDWLRHEPLVTRYADRELARIYADLSAETFEWMIENGVQFEDEVAGGGFKKRPHLAMAGIRRTDHILSHATRLGIAAGAGKKRPGQRRTGSCCCTKCGI